MPHNQHDCFLLVSFFVNAELFSLFSPFPYLDWLVCAGRRGREHPALGAQRRHDLGVRVLDDAHRLARQRRGRVGGQAPHLDRALHVAHDHLQGGGGLTNKRMMGVCPDKTWGHIGSDLEGGAIDRPRASVFIFIII